MNRRDFVKLSSLALASVGSKKLPSFVYRNVPPPIPVANLLGQWNFTEGQNQIVFNRTGPATYPSFTNLFGTGSEQFAANIANSEGWAKTGGTTLTDFFATDPFGNNGATRVVTTSGSDQGINNSLSLAAATYTISFYVKSNTGSSQAVRIGAFGTSVSTDKTVTTSWTQISFTFTIGSPASYFVGLENDTAQDVLDILVYGAILQSGGSASAYTPPIFDLQLGSLPVADAHDPTWQTYGADFGNSIYAYGIGTIGATPANFTVYAAAKWTGPSASGGLEFMIDNGGGGLSGTFVLATANIVTDALQGNQRPNFVFGTDAAYANSLNLTDHAWHVFTGTYDGTTIRLYMDGTEVGSKTSTQSALAIHRLYFGANPQTPPSQYYFPGSVGIAAMYAVAHSPATIRQMVATLQSDMACRSIITGSQPRFIMIEGDSISDCNVISTGLTIYQGWAYLMFHDISPIVQGRNFATSGGTIATMTSHANLVDETFNPTLIRNILSILIGGNDLVTDSPATYLSNLKTYCLARKAANPALKIGIIPILPRTLAGFNANRNTANALVAADPDFTNGNAADIIATVDPSLWADAAASNLTLYSDGTHPTVIGMQILEPVAKAMCLALF